MILVGDQERRVKIVVGGAGRGVCGVVQLESSSCRSAAKYFGRLEYGHVVEILLIGR